MKLQQKKNMLQKIILFKVLSRGMTFLRKLYPTPLHLYLHPIFFWKKMWLLETTLSAKHDRISPLLSCENTSVLQLPTNNKPSFMSSLNHIPELLIEVI